MKLLATLFTSLLLTAGARSQGADIAIVAAASPGGTGTCEFTDIQTKLMATGFFGSVDVIDASVGTPTLAELMQYPALFVFSNVPFANGEILGDVLADYVDAGGGVVGPCIPANSFGGGLQLGGRWATGGYEIFADPQQAIFGTLSLGVVPDPGHPLMKDVSSFGGFVRPTSTELQVGAQVIAFWDDGGILAVVGANPQRVDFGFFPVSTDCLGPGITWVATTDGARLMANALLFVAGNIPTIYCTAKTSSLGCLPSIGYQGSPSATESDGFVVHAVDVPNQKVGILFYSVAGRAALPFQGATLCLAGPYRRTLHRLSGGNTSTINDCTGGWRIDMNAFAAGAIGGSPSPELGMGGTQVFCQWWGRDPFDPFGTALSNALRYTVNP